MEVVPEMEMIAGNCILFWDAKSEKRVPIDGNQRKRVILNLMKRVFEKK